MSLISLPFETVIMTSGTGLWSNHVRRVIITELELAYCSDDEEFGELRVHFCPSTWNIDKHGLIYTDDVFLDRLRDAIMERYPFSTGGVNDINYSEQGMQGGSYVSFDVDRQFIKEINEIVEEIE